MWRHRSHGSSLRPEWLSVPVGCFHACSHFVFIRHQLSSYDRKWSVCLEKWLKIAVRLQICSRSDPSEAPGRINFIHLICRKQPNVCTCVKSRSVISCSAFVPGHAWFLSVWARWTLHSQHQSAHSSHRQHSHTLLRSHLQSCCPPPSPSFSLLLMMVLTV